MNPSQSFIAHSPNKVSHTPEGFRFGPRPLRTEWPENIPRWWNAGRAFDTHFMNALSVTFPHGEKFFVDAVRHYRDRISDPRLQEEISAFIGQEGWHRSVHRDYNDWLQRLGLPAHRLDTLAAERIAAVKARLKPRGWLAATVSLEHFTAFLAHTLIADPGRLEAMHPKLRQVWTWHALEELEHKGVAFDVYLAIGGRRAPLRRAMLLVTLTFLFDITRNLIALLRADRVLWRPRTWVEAAGFLFGMRRGLIWRTLPAWFAFFGGQFHPWRHDDRRLIEQARTLSGLAN